MKRKLSDSKIFNELVYNQKLKTNLKYFNTTNESVPLQLLEDSTTAILKKMNFTTKDVTMKYLRDGSIRVVNNPEYSLPRFLNVVGKITPTGLNVIVDISAYGTMSQTNGQDTLSIYPKTLFSLLQNGMILLELNKKWDRYTSNINLIRNAAMSYTRLTCKVLDKMMGININETKSDIVFFIMAKFFILNVCGVEILDTEAVNMLAREITINGTSLEFLLEAEAILDTDKAYSNIFSLFTELKKLDGLAKLNIRPFIEQYLRMYGEGSMLSLDYLPSFISLIFATYVGANINKDYIIDSVSGKTNARIINEFMKVM